MANDVWTLTGTPEQVALAHHVLYKRCDFPWERLLPGLKARVGTSAIPIEWIDLTRWGQDRAHRAGATHDGHHHDHDADAHPLEVRERVLGLFWYSGKVSIEQSLTSDPTLAGEVILSEAAHAVDRFYLTADMRRAIWDLMHEGHPHDPAHNASHGWFETPFTEWTGEME